MTQDGHVEGDRWVQRIPGTQSFRCYTVMNNRCIDVGLAKDLQAKNHYLSGGKIMRSTKVVKP